MIDRLIVNLIKLDDQVVNLIKNQSSDEGLGENRWKFEHRAKFRPIRVEILQIKFHFFFIFFYFYL